MVQIEHVREQNCSAQEMKTLLILAAVVATIGCSPSRDIRREAINSGRCFKWTPEMVRGFTLELSEQPELLVMSFPLTGDEMTVYYQSGDEMSVGWGWVWQIGKEGDLEVTRYLPPRHTREVTNYRLLSFSDDMILARSNDRRLEFRRYPNQIRTSHARQPAITSLIESEIDPPVPPH